MIEIRFTECENPKDVNSYGYGDYMLKLAHRTNGGWLYADLCPHAGISVYPSAAALGVCAEETVRIMPRGDGKLAVFRLGDYLSRLDMQARDMGLPTLDRELTEYGIKQLLSLSRPYLNDGTVLLQLTLLSLETDPSVYPVREAVLTVTLKKEKSVDIGTMSVCASTDCVMAHPHKFGAPFAFSVRDGLNSAKKRGFDSVLWLDSVYARYVEALAGMDIFFHIGQSVYCAGDGITADSVKALMAEWGIALGEGRLSTDSIIKEYRAGNLSEVFAVSTKHTVIPVTLVDIDGTQLELTRVKLAKKLHDTLAGICSGDYPNTHGWVTLI